MHITLVLPSVGRKGKKYIKTWTMEPLAIAVLASLTPADVKITFFDDRLEDVDYDAPTDLVGISVESYTSKRAYEIAAEYHKRGVPVVMGGYHATLVPEEVQNHAEATVIGDAEPVWAQVVDDAKNGRLKKVYRAERQTLSSEMTIPDRSIYADKKYLGITLLETGRGCKFHCEFCSVTAFYEGDYRRKSVDLIVEEIRATGSKQVFFVDDNIIGDVEYAKELFTALIPLNIKWVTQCSLNAVKDRELLDLMVKSGCVGILVGFESIAKDNLVQMHKGQNNGAKDYSGALAQLRQRGVVIYATFVFGYDNDDAGLIQRTVDFCREEKIFIAAFNHLVPFPGTPLYGRLKSEDKLLIEKWWLDPDYQYGDISFYPKSVSPDELTRLCLVARNEFYGVRSIIERSLDFHANSKSPKWLFLFLLANFMLRKEVMEKRSLMLGSES